MHLRMLPVQSRRATADRIAGLLKSTGHFGRPTAYRIRLMRHASVRLKRGGTAADGIEIVVNVNGLARAREQ